MNKYKKLAFLLGIMAIASLFIACQPYARVEPPTEYGHHQENPYKHWGSLSDDFNLEHKGKQERQPD